MWSRSKSWCETLQNTRIYNKADNAAIYKSINKPALMRSQEPESGQYEGVKNLVLLKETCAQLNKTRLDCHTQPARKEIDVDCLLQDINQEECSRLPTRVSHVYDVDCSLEALQSELHDCLCSETCLQNKTANKFRQSLKTIVEHISTFLQKTEISNSNNSETTPSNSNQNVRRLAQIEDHHSTGQGFRTTCNETNHGKTLTDQRVRRKCHPFASSSEEDQGSCEEELSSSNTSSSDNSSIQRDDHMAFDNFRLKVLGRGRIIRSEGKPRLPKFPSSALPLSHSSRPLWSSTSSALPSRHPPSTSSTESDEPHHF